ncbi:hypothetical protein F5144DRAFT_487202 [Chaetomium tenue]|uniref:Uncharacterized protein n=1 Tax=Chaetomium tenue TaxID=1854479 RepID=A0ACB7PC32_9PEZI|nr:hypothetical protein F5144DRAFT_487202 [Chaetomium globosum]
MRSLTRIFSVLAYLVVLPLVTTSPHHHPHHPSPNRIFYDIGNQIADRSMMIDAAQFNFAPFKVTNLHILCTRFKPTVDYSCNLTFAWSDPNSVRQNSVTSGHCQTSWAWDGVTKHQADPDGSNPVAEYRSCWINDDATYFKVAVPGFWHPGNFTLELAHRYRDDEYVFPHPSRPSRTPFGNRDVIIDDGALTDAACGSTETLPSLGIIPRRLGMFVFISARNKHSQTEWTISIRALSMGLSLA